MANMLTPPKKKIGDVKAFALILVALICGGFKILLFFFNGIPIFGTAIDVIVSFFVSILEVLIDFGTLGFSGLFSGEGSLVNIVLAGAATVFDFTPILDDAPITAPLVLFMIWRSRRQYKKDLARYESAIAAEQQASEADYSVRFQRAQNAALRANNRASEIANDTDSDDFSEVA